MTHLQQIIAGDHETWIQFTQSLLFIAGLIVLFVAIMNWRWIVNFLLDIALFVVWTLIPVVRVVFAVYNFFAGIIYNIRMYERTMRLTTEEEAELNENVFNQPLGI